MAQQQCYCFMRPVSHSWLNTETRSVGDSCSEQCGGADAQLVWENAAANLQESLVAFLDKCLYRMIYMGSKVDPHSRICSWALSLSSVS